jgi:hypothetical protein
MLFAVFASFSRVADLSRNHFACKWSGPSRPMPPDGKPQLATNSLAILRGNAKTTGNSYDKRYDVCAWGRARQARRSQ